MAITPLRMLLFLGGASGAAVGTAYTLGAFDPLMTPQAAVTAPAAVVAKPGQPAEIVKPVPTPEQQAALQAKPEQPASAADPIVPSFDILRAEPDGSVVIAGKAAAGAEIEILSGDKVLGKAKATPEGDFAAVLDEPLKPGDYQINLRSTTQTKVVAESKETAVVSIPASKDGQVLAMVEQPGAPSRIITKPETAAAPANPPAETAPASAPAADAQKPVATTTASPPDAATPAPDGKPFVPVAVEAVEIEGSKIFVAGAAAPGAPVRVYANDQLLGETRATPEGRFLLEVQRDLPVGDYQVRADALGPDGKKVLARAEVGFSREPGESIAAVAPAPEQPAVSSQPAPSAEPAAAAGQQQAGAPATAQQPQPDGAPAKPGQAAVPVAATNAEQPPKLQTVTGGVIIRRGDSLWRISRRVYGRGVRFSTIYLANNAQIRDPNRIYPGQIFRVPDKTQEGEAADMKGMGEQATTVE